MKQTRSVLLKTSSISDVQHSGGNLAITGLNGIRYNDILDFKQIKQRAEVVKVTKVGYSLYTPTASTRYAVKISYPSRKREGWTGYDRVYGYTTPSVLTNIGATAALQREYIHGQIIDAINADSSNYVLAASLLTGTGFNITDDAGYYPARTGGASGGRTGASTITVITNPDNSGWIQSAEVVDTTSPIYSFGDGTRMSQDAPVQYAYTGNIIQGEIDAPRATDGTFATAGQKYDAFFITSLGTQDAHAVTDQIAHVYQTDIVFADNGTGTSTTNLAGFKAFERAMQKALFGLYAQNPSTVIEWFDKPIVFQDPLGAAPTGTANTLGWQLSPYGSLNRTNIGTQTIVAPVLDATGLLIDQDDTAGDGSHTSANQQTLGCQSFIVGKSEFSVSARVVMGDWTDSHLLVGFRKKAVYAADYNDYTDLAAIGSGAAAGDTITTTGILNNAATVATASAVSFADAVSVELLVKVAIDGSVTCYVDGVSYPIYSAGTTAMVFDADDELIPFYQHVNIGNGNPAVSISKFVAVPVKDWLVTAQ